MSELQVEIVTPESLLLSETVSMVTIPGEMGDFGVLPGHAPLISTLRPGIIEVYQGESKTHRFFVRGGFAEVTTERCTLLAENATDVKDKSTADITAQIEALQKECDTLKASKLDHSEEIARLEGDIEAYQTLKEVL